MVNEHFSTDFVVHDIAESGDLTDVRIVRDGDLIKSDINGRCLNVVTKVFMTIVTAIRCQSDTVLI